MVILCEQTVLFKASKCRAAVPAGFRSLARSIGRLFLGRSRVQLCARSSVRSIAVTARERTVGTRVRHSVCADYYVQGFNFRNLIARSLDCSLARSHARSIARSAVCAIVEPIAQSFARSVARRLIVFLSPARSLGRSIARANTRANEQGPYWRT